MCANSIHTEEAIRLHSRKQDPQIPQVVNRAEGEAGNSGLSSDPGSVSFQEARAPYSGGVGGRNERDAISGRCELPHPSAPSAEGHRQAFSRPAARTAARPAGREGAPRLSLRSRGRTSSGPAVRAPHRGGTAGGGARPPLAPGSPALKWRRRQLAHTPPPALFQSRGRRRREPAGAPRAGGRGLLGPSSTARATEL